MLEQKYPIIESIKHNVFKAIDNLTKKTVIIKKISFSAVSSKEKEHIVQQVNTLVSMDYVHILKYLDFEINKKDITVDIAMEDCQGGTIADLIRQHKKEGKRIQQDEIWRIFYQLVQAIGYIHRDNIIHRNINPNSIYFKENKRSNIKLGGFSLVKKVDFEEEFASTVITNTHYLSPEQIQTGLCSKETDIWALGCLICEMCMLQSPFRHSNEFEKAKMIKEFKPKKIKGYSIELNRLIYWCLKKNPEQRPTLSDIQGAPDISLRIRQRRLQQRSLWVLNKEEQLLRREHELFEKKKELQLKKNVSKYESLKKKNSDVLSNRNISYLKKSC